MAGNSLGGNIAWHMALMGPDRVRQLILIDAAGYPFTPKSVLIGFRLVQLPLVSGLVAKLTPDVLFRSSLENLGQLEYRKWIPVQAIVESLRQMHSAKHDLSPTFRRAGMNLCEEVARQEGFSETVQQLLSFFQPAKPNERLYFFNNNLEEVNQAVLTLYVRGEVLRSELTDSPLAVEDFYPTELIEYLNEPKEQKKDRHSGEWCSDQKRRCDQLYPHMLAFFRARTRLLLATHSEADFEQAFAHAAKKLQDDWEMRYYREMELGQYMTFLAHAMLDVLPHYGHPDTLVRLQKETFLRKPQNVI